ncbi:hypothetical protein D3C87_78580 [compost metagenome]
MKRANSKNKTIRFFLLSFMLICIFSVSTIWINFVQFKSASEKNSYRVSELITIGIGDRYKSVNEFITSVEPFVTDTMKSILSSMEDKITTMGVIDNDALAKLKKQYNISDIYVIDNQGLVKYSTVQESIGSNTAALYKNRTDIEWSTIFKNVQQNKEIYVDNFTQSPTYPYNFTKLAYKGIGYIDNIGFVVLEIGLSIDDIKDASVSDLVANLEKIDENNENILEVKFENSPPNTNGDTYFKNESYKIGDKYYTKMKAENLDGGTSQISVVTSFHDVDKAVLSSMYNAIITSLFIVLFTIIISILFSYRFSFPTENNYRKEALEKTIDELKKMQ